MPGFLDRRRAGRLMREEGLEALVLAQPESITYAAGAFPGVASFWRRAGAAFLLVPADEHQPLTAIVGDLQAKSFREASGIDDVRSHRIWVEKDGYRPAETSLELGLGGESQVMLHPEQILGRLRVESPTAAQVQGVWVAPDRRGEGLAIRGMAAVVAHVRREVAPVVSLYVNEFNVPARRAYEHVGFTESARFATIMF